MHSALINTCFLAFISASPSVGSWFKKVVENPHNLSIFMQNSSYRSRVRLLSSLQTNGNLLEGLNFREKKAWIDALRAYPRSLESDQLELYVSNRHAFFEPHVKMSTFFWPFESRSGRASSRSDEIGLVNLGTRLSFPEHYYPQRAREDWWSISYEKNYDLQLLMKRQSVDPLLEEELVAGTIFQLIDLEPRLLTYLLEDLSGEIWLQSDLNPTLRWQDYFLLSQLFDKDYLDLDEGKNLLSSDGSVFFSNPETAFALSFALALFKPNSSHRVVNIFKLIDLNSVSPSLTWKDPWIHFLQTKEIVLWQIEHKEHRLFPYSKELLAQLKAALKTFITDIRDLGLNDFLLREKFLVLTETYAQMLSIARVIWNPDQVDELLVQDLLQVSEKLDFTLVQGDRFALALESILDPSDCQYGNDLAFSSFLEKIQNRRFFPRDRAVQSGFLKIPKVLRQRLRVLASISADAFLLGKASALLQHAEPASAFVTLSPKELKKEYQDYFQAQRPRLFLQQKGKSRHLQTNFELPAFPDQVLKTLLELRSRVKKG